MGKQITAVLSVETMNRANARVQKVAADSPEIPNPFNVFLEAAVSTYCDKLDADDKQTEIKLSADSSE